MPGSGTPEELLAAAGIDAAHIVEAARGAGARRAAARVGRARCGSRSPPTTPGCCCAAGRGAPGRAGYDLIDLGIDDPDEPDDYPDRAADLGRAVAGGEAEVGLLLCGSGAGAAIAANKIRGVRAASATTSSRRARRARTTTRT